MSLTLDFGQFVSDLSPTRFPKQPPTIAGPVFFV